MYSVNKFSFLRTAVYVALHSFLERLIFIYLILTPIIKSNGISTLTITNAIVVHEVAKIIFDTPSSVLADKISPINVIICGIFLKILGLLCIFYYKNFIPLSFFAAMFFVGTGSALMFSKIEPYIYSNLKAINEERVFPKMDLVRTISANSAAIITGVIVGFFNKNSLHKVVLLPIFSMLFLHIPLLLKLRLDPFSKTIIKNKKRFWLQIVRDAVRAILKNKSMGLVLFMLIVVSSTFIVVADCYKAVLASAKVSNRTMGLIYSINHFFPIAISCFFFFKKQKLSLKNIFFAYIILLTIPMLATVYTKNIIPFVASVLLLLAFMPIVRIAAVAEFERLSLDSARFTLFSFSSLGTSILNTILITFFGLLSENVSHTWSFFLVMLIFVIASVFIAKSFKNKSD